jgi:hypothetical protein
MDIMGLAAIDTQQPKLYQTGIAKAIRKKRERNGKKPEGNQRSWDLMTQ